MTALPFPTPDSRSVSEFKKIERERERRADTLRRLMADISRQMTDRARDANDRLRRADAAQMVREPWRIGNAIYGKKCWPPVNGDTPSEALAECRRHIEAERPSASTFWLRDLLAAEDALLQIIGEGRNP